MLFSLSFRHFGDVIFSVVLIACFWLFLLFDHSVTSVLGGLKSLQSSETLMGIRSSFETMTASVRDTLVETWALDEDEDEEPSWATTQEKDEHDSNHLDERMSEGTVQLDGTEDSYGLSLQSNDEEGFNYLMLNPFFFMFFL